MLCIDFKSNDPEALIGILSQFPFEGYQEFEETVQAYMEDTSWPGVERDVLRSISGLGNLLQVQPLEEKNWNAEWEASFQPVCIDDFCAIRASFHEPIMNCKYELVIDPRMAFGTGHHETTALMILQMRDLPIQNADILDLGCGTGILAILAAKMGAGRVLAVDNDPEAVRNTIENTEINGTEFETLCTTVDMLPQATHDIVLANINRNTLLEIMGLIRNVMKDQGLLLLSGILVDDEAVIRHAAEKAGIIKTNTRRQGEWISMLLQASA